MPKISVIIPVHNTEKYLSTCLNSVLNQTIEDIEVICINDHSIDKSLEILKKYEKEFSNKMIIIDMKEKNGVSCARNEGLKLASGEYIGFVDSDDVVSLNMFEDFYNYAKEYQVSLVIGHNKRIESEAFQNLETFQTKRSSPTLLDVTKKENMNHFICSCWDKLFSHDLIADETFLENRIYEDVGFTFPLIFKAKKVLEVKERDYYYRKNVNGISSSSEKMNVSVFDIFYIVQDAMKRGKKYQLTKEQMSSLENYLKKAILCRIQFLTLWDLKEREKKYLIERTLSVFNYFFPNIKNIQLKDNDVAGNALINLQNYGYEELTNAKEALEMFKRIKRFARSRELKK